MSWLPLGYLDHIQVDVHGPSLVTCAIIQIGECANQGEAAEIYADLIRLSNRGLKSDWAKVNDAVKARWPKGLLSVKKRAWKVVEGR